MYICVCVYAPQHLKLLAFIVCLPQNSLSLENRTLRALLIFLAVIPALIAGHLHSFVKYVCLRVS